MTDNKTEYVDWLPRGYAGEPQDFSTFSMRLIESYRSLLGTSLLPAAVSRDEAPRWLYEEAPMCVLGHSGGADPIFNYANRAAQACFEYSWTEFVSLPSRLSAAPVDRDERQRLFDIVARDRFATGYRGLRVARSGRKFWIEDVVIWQVSDADGIVQGEAAAFPHWRNA
jgi:hypothetical protein